MARLKVTDVALTVNPSTGDTHLSAYVESGGESYPIGAANVVNASSTKADVEKYIIGEVERQIEEKRAAKERIGAVQKAVKEINLPEEFTINTGSAAAPKNKRVTTGKKK